MNGNLKYCMSLLQENEESMKKEAQQILLKLCSNILKNPQDERYRKIKLVNAIVSSKLLPASGAIECLFEAGFVESDDGFLLPTNASLAGIEELHRLLNDSPQPQEVEPQPSTSMKTNTATNVPKPTVCTRKPFTRPVGHEGYHFLNQLKRHFQDVMRYEDQSLQNKVKLILPLEKLQINAMEKLRNVQREIKIKNLKEEVVFEDFLLSELLSWFKTKFFTWVDTLLCRHCERECYNDGSVVSENPAISRIEIHRCGYCGLENQFPRYTDPEQLLYTRKGRCGEWANCFTLICRTVGFDARLVYDQTDHVWTEVWSIAHNRWIHADACENAMDTPLVYEKGWGKKLSYVVAFSRDEIIDVTCRYTQNFDEVMKRRNLCSENTLVSFINKLNISRQTSDEYSSARRKFVLKRSAIELAEMITAPPGLEKPSDSVANKYNYSERTSGSLSWRLSRGEVGSTTYKSNKWIIPRRVSYYELSYSIVTDSFIAKDIKNDKILEKRDKWQNGIYHMEGGIFRKEETDWKMVYLARSPESKSGKITWIVKLEDGVEATIENLELQAKTSTFNNATIEWNLEGDCYGDTKFIRTTNVKKLQTRALKLSREIKITAILSGGEGDVAWQHAQLFRQSLNDSSTEPSMIIRMKLDQSRERTPLPDNWTPVAESQSSKDESSSDS